ncbi:MAG: sugar phosphate isomerase/epimerase family protein [Candidatus Latescibacterota bacterium]|nr:sugar phosphate isomerase/epimerase family protein [Candidatus Latescibacterota bacterium]
MEKTWTWTTTGYSFVGKSHDEISQICRHAGLSGFEAADEVFPSETDAELESARARFAEAGLRFDSFHLPLSAAADICSFYETTRREAVEMARHSMERAAILGARVGIQHPSTNRFDAEAEGLDRYLSQLDKSLQVLLPAAEKLDFTLALENMLPGDQGGRLGSRPEHFERITAEFGHSNLGFCLDTGHALVAGGGREEADAFVEAMGPHLVAFHLADNAGDRDSHLAPGHGRVDFGAAFRTASATGYKYSMCIETPPFAQGPAYSLDAWKQMVVDTEALADAALSARNQVTS